MKPTKISISIETAKTVTDSLLRKTERDDKAFREIVDAIACTLGGNVGAPPPPWVAALEAGEAAQRETDAKASVHYDKLALLATIGILCQAVRDAYGVHKVSNIAFTFEHFLTQQSAITRAGKPVRLQRGESERFPLFGWVDGDNDNLLQWDKFGKWRESSVNGDSQFDLFVKG